MTRGAGAAAFLVATCSHGGLHAQQSEPRLDRLYAAASALASPDSAARHGFTRLRPLASEPAVNPFVGEHWLNHRWLRHPEPDPSRPAYLMYYPIGGKERLVGIGEAVLQASGAPPPSGLGPSHGWHVHHPCGGLTGIGNLLVAGAAECRELGGTPGATQIAMRHVWLEPANPAGKYASENPVLPFVAAGIDPPDSSALADPASGPMLRALGLALGESMGVKPRLGTLVEYGRDSSRFRAVARPLRDTLRAVVDRLREARLAGDLARSSDLSHRAIAVWKELQRAYLDLAHPAGVRTLLARWFETVLTATGHGLTH